jgi:hypothetical protein
MGQVMKANDLHNMIREIIREELQSVINEEEYDYYRDYRDGNISWEEYQDLVKNFQRRNNYSSWDNFIRGHSSKPRRSYPPRPASPTTPAPAADKNTMLQQKIKYKDAEGKEHEATVKSLLGYAKDHPGRKLAARVYAQFMAKSRPATPSAPQKENSEEKMCEGEGCLDEKSVPQPYDRKKARKMSKSQVDNRKRIGRNMMSNEKTVSKFRKKFGDDWKSHLWAAASSAAIRSSGDKKSK